VDALLEFGTAQAVEVSLMPEVLVGGELEVDALGLEDDADMAAQRSGLANGVEAGDGGAAGSGDHEGGKYAEESGLAAAVRAEKAEKFGGVNVEGDAIERGAVLIAVDEVANDNDGLASELGWLGGRSEVEGG